MLQFSPGISPCLCLLLSAELCACVSGFSVTLPDPQHRSVPAAFTDFSWVIRTSPQRKRWGMLWFVVIKTTYKVLKRPPLLKVYFAIGRTTRAQELSRPDSKKCMVLTKSTERGRGKDRLMTNTYLLTEQSKRFLTSASQFHVTGALLISSFSFKNKMTSV